MLMGKCWQGFLLGGKFLCRLTCLLIPRSDRFCGSTALRNRSHAAGSRGDSLVSLLQPQRRCLLAHTDPTAMPRLGLSEAGCILHSCESGFSSKKLGSVKPLGRVSLARFAQTKAMMDLLQKTLLLGVRSVPSNFSNKVCAK